MKLPTLYKKTNTGAIQFWDIYVSVEAELVPPDGGSEPSYPTIVTIYGQLDTKSPQITRDAIKEGKNSGKKNETTPLQQAEAEARAKWEKQLKKGYVQTVQSAQSGEIDELIEGGIVPMLAHKFSEQAHKIKYPAYVQPKLDGIRCIAILKDGKCTLWSRTRKQITGVPHIARFIEQHFTGDTIFDGELYNHEYKDNFEKIVSLVRQEEPGEGHEIVQYHIYDLAEKGLGSFETRTRIFELIMFDTSRIGGPLEEVDTRRVISESEVLEAFESYKSMGYEGCMVRNSEGLYENKRSYNLQKVKEFDDSEFDIVGVEEGRGKLAGHALLVCKDSKGDTFPVKMKGDTAMLKRYFEDHTLWQGKKLTIQYQGLTGKNKVPRFPVGLAIRDYE